MPRTKAALLTSVQLRAMLSVRRISAVLAPPTTVQVGMAKGQFSCPDEPFFTDARTYS
jgi:hypothetical protein